MTKPSIARGARVVAVLVCGGVVVAGLMAASIHFNLQRACVVKDTPYLDICPNENDTAFTQKVEAIQSRIDHGLGDSRAYVELAFLYNRITSKVGGEAADDSLRAAIKVAPHDPDVLRLQVNKLTQAGNWSESIPVLIELAEFHTDMNAATVLALWSSQDVRVSRALAAYVKSESRWFGHVLGSARRDVLPVAKMIPLISEGIAKGLVTHRALQPVMQGLKANGQWADAYGLWMQQNGGALGPLYNASFEQPLRADGFDWELNAGAGPRPGAVAQRMRLSDRGYVLGVQYSGRAIAAPVARQQLFLFEGRYRLDGQYMVEKLRSEKGLAWVARCEGSGAELGRSPSLTDTRGAWTAFGFDINVPRNCLSVVNLQLETAAPFESTAGVNGRAYFDGFALVRAGASAAATPASEVVR